MNAKGPVFKYGDNIDTDVIIPARYLNTQSPAELAAHCMEDLDSDFKRKSETSRIIVAGRNFGGIGGVEVAGGDDDVRIDVIAVSDDGRLNEHVRAPPQAWRRGP